MWPNLNLCVVFNSREQLPTSPSMLPPQIHTTTTVVQRNTKIDAKCCIRFAIHGQFTHGLDVDLANRTDFAENAAVDLFDTKILFMFAPDGAESTQRTSGMSGVVVNVCCDAYM